MTPYVYERQVEYWTNSQLEIALKSMGFDVSCHPITPRLENALGVDAIFGGDPVIRRVFGLQYKALHRGEPNFWQATSQQHSVLLRHTWAYYCLSDVRSMGDGPATLRLARFTRPRHTPIDRRSRINAKGEGFRYWRWNSFSQALLHRKIGRAVTSRSALARLLGDSAEATEIATSIVLMTWTGTSHPTPGASTIFTHSLEPNANDIRGLIDDRRPAHGRDTTRQEPQERRATEPQDE
jgi:hypothetical protein